MKINYLNKREIKKKILVDKAEKFLNHSYEQINDIFLNKISMDDTKEEVTVEQLTDEIHDLSNGLPFRKLPLPYKVSKRVKF